MNIFTLALKENLKHRINVVLVCLIPFPLLLIPKNESGFPFGINLYGLLAFYTAFLLARPIAEDRMKGLILRIAASPVSTIRYLACHFAAYLLQLALQMALFLAGSALTHRLGLLVYLNLLLLYLSFAFMSTAFAVAWNTLFRSYNLSFGLFAGLGSLACLISGISMPLVFIPQSVQRFTMFLPTYWLPYGLEALWGAHYPELILSHGILLAYAVVFLLAGSKRSL